MNRNPGKWSRVALRALLFACLGWGCLGNGMAEVVTIQGTPTTLQSNTERMISLRHQQHMWETADGATHVIVNRGELSDGDSLQLYSSFDQGLTWTAGPRLPSSDRYSTSDGYLADDILYVTHSTPAGAVFFTALQYDAGTGKWSQLWSETAFSSHTTIAINPAMAADATGTIWLAFVAQSIAGGNYSIRLLRNTSQQEGWVNTGFVFGAVDNASIERSARPVATATGIGMVYTVHEKIYWASRENDWPLTAQWQRQQLFSSQSGDVDPYASHFSVVADAQQNIHMATVDGGRVRYFRLDAATRLWGAKWLSDDINAGYVQATVVAGNIVVAANNNTNIAVFQSMDSGGTFTVPYGLVHPAPPSSGTTYRYPRIETAATTAGPMLLLQQYVKNGTQRLLLFNVPLP